MKYRNKPVVIDAWRVSDLIAAFTMRWSDLPPLVASAYDSGTIVGITAGEFTVKTLEGDMVAKRGDMLIRGVQSEFYPCKPDIFEATYEAAGEPSTEENER